MVFSYEGRVMVWGGYAETDDYTVHSYWPADEIMVYDTLTKSWITKKTHGRSPPQICGATGTVISNYLYVICGFYHFEPKPPPAADALGNALDNGGGGPDKLKETLEITYVPTSELKGGDAGMTTQVRRRNIK